MNAKEYRLGNLINSNEIDINNGTKVNIPVEVDMGILFELQRGNICNRYSPIPLTEEWFCKFEFSKFFGQIKYDTDRFWACEYIGKGIWFFKDLELKIEYVHQLQNVFFIYTGEELTIK